MPATQLTESGTGYGKVIQILLAKCMPELLISAEEIYKVKTDKAEKPRQAVVAHAFHPNTRRQRQGEPSVSSKLAWST